MDMSQLQKLLKFLLKETRNSAPDLKTINRLAKLYLAGSKGKWGDLSNPRNAKNKCEDLAKEFTNFALYSGVEASVMEMNIGYLDEDATAFQHYATVIGEFVIDFTASQFFGPDTEVPIIFEQVEEWVEAIDQVLEGKYEYPSLWPVPSSE